jgi:hypothetical protein
MARTPREAIWFPIDTGIKENAERAAQIMSQTQNKKVCQWHAVSTALVAFINQANYEEHCAHIGDHVKTKIPFWRRPKGGTIDDCTTKKERTVLASVVDEA